MYRLAQIAQGGKSQWYYFREKDGGSKLILYLCEGCESRETAHDYVLNLKKNKSRVSAISRGMYDEASASYEKRRQFGKSVYGWTLAQKKMFLREINKDFGDVPIQEITEKDVEARLLQIERSGSWKNSYLETFMDIYREARWQGIKVALPAFQKFKRNSRKADVLSERDEKALLSKRNFSNSDLRLMFWLGLCCGLRLGEMRALRAGQFLADKGAIVVDGYINKMGERTKYNKKGSEERPKFRVAFLTENLSKALAAYIEEKGLAGDDFLFTMDEKPFSQSYAYKNFVAAARRAGLLSDGRKISPHSLRYTYITRMRSLLPGETVRKLAGHSSIEMTDYYTRASLGDLIEELSPTKESVERCFGAMEI